MKPVEAGWKRLVAILRLGPLEGWQIKMRLGGASGGAVMTAQRKGLIEKGEYGWQLVQPKAVDQDQAST